MKRVQVFELIIFIVSLVAYFALANWMTRAWTLLGDEPHYLLAAHSLVHDRDLNLANNYANGDFNAFLEGDTLDPHVKVLPDGTQILNHDLGLPVVLAIPYALGGRAGVEYFLALAGALLAWQMWHLAYDVTRSPLWAALGWFALAFTPPLVLYATLIYPEVLGALIFIWATRTLLKPLSQVSRVRLGILAVAIAILPWLSVRFVVLLVLVLVFVAVQWSGAWRRVVWIYALAALGAGAYLWVNNIVLAGVVPAGSPGALATGNLSTLSPAPFVRGIVGWWIDPQRGTLVMAPVYILALAGIPRLVRADRRTAFFLLSPLLVLVLLVTLFGGFWIPFEVGARYFVVALPLLAAPLALALRAGLNQSPRARWQGAVFGAFAALLLLLSLWNSALMLTDASYAYGSVVSAYSRAIGTDVSPLFAGMGRPLLVTPQNAPPSSGNVDVEVQEFDGEPVWRSAPERAGNLVSSFDLTELTVGHYSIDFRASVRGGLPDAETLTLDVYSAEGLPLAHSSWRASDLQAERLQPIAVEFDNPYFDRWGFPLTLQVASTGNGDVRLSAIRFNPDTLISWLRAGVWLALVFAVVVVLNLDLFRPSARVC